jgi:hypothetical protein
MQINALPSKEMNSLSPRVVSKRKIPKRGPPPGLKYSQIDIVRSSKAITAKNIAVGCVHAIQVSSIDTFLAVFYERLGRPELSKILLLPQFLYAARMTHRLVIQPHQAKSIHQESDAN